MISKRENTRKALDGSWYFLFLETFIAIANYYISTYSIICQIIFVMHIDKKKKTW